MNYHCIICDYHTARDSQYQRHLLTAKHKFLINPNEKVQSNNVFICTCNKQYKHLSSLCAHKKKCYHNPSANTPQIPVLENSFIQSPALPVDQHVIIELLKQNQEFKDLLIEQNKQMIALCKDNCSRGGNITNNNNNHNNIKNQNNQFNLQFFLNETCKDAININEFIDNVSVSFKQLENIDKNGYVAGVTDVILSHLKTLDITHRPLHCTDLKRDTMYIKEDDAWVKDNDENDKMTQLFRRITKKSIKSAYDWSDNHPNSLNSDCKENDFLINVLLNSIGKIGDEQAKFDNKVLKSIARVVLVDRNI